MAVNFLVLAFPYRYFYGLSFDVFDIFFGPSVFLGLDVFNTFVSFLGLDVFNIPFWPVSFLSLDVFNILVGPSSF